MASIYLSRNAIEIYYLSIKTVDIENNNYLLVFMYNVYLLVRFYNVNDSDFRKLHLYF